MPVWRLLAGVTSEESINSFNMWVFLSSSVVGGEEKQSTCVFLQKVSTNHSAYHEEFGEGQSSKEEPTHTPLPHNLALSLTRICVRDEILE